MRKSLQPQERIAIFASLTVLDPGGSGVRHPLLDQQVVGRGSVVDISVACPQGCFVLDFDLDPDRARSGVEKIRQIHSSCDARYPIWNCMLLGDLPAPCQKEKQANANRRLFYTWGVC